MRRAQASWSLVYQCAVTANADSAISARPSWCQLEQVATVEGHYSLLQRTFFATKLNLQQRCEVANTSQGPSAEQQVQSRVTTPPSKLQDHPASIRRRKQCISCVTHCGQTRHAILFTSSGHTLTGFCLHSLAGMHARGGQVILQQDAVEAIGRSEVGGRQGVLIRGGGVGVLLGFDV